MVLEIDQVFNFPASIHPGLSTKHTTRAPRHVCLNFNSKVPHSTQWNLWSVDNYIVIYVYAVSVGYQASMLITWHGIVLSAKTQRSSKNIWFVLFKMAHIILLAIDLTFVTVNQSWSWYSCTKIVNMFWRRFAIFESVSGCRRVFEHLKQISER